MTPLTKLAWRAFKDPNSVWASTFFRKYNKGDD